MLGPSPSVRRALSVTPSGATRPTERCPLTGRSIPHGAEIARSEDSWPGGEIDTQSQRGECGRGSNPLASDKWACDPRRCPATPSMNACHACVRITTCVGTRGNRRGGGSAGEPRDAPCGREGTSWRRPCDGLSLHGREPMIVKADCPHCGVRLLLLDSENVGVIGSLRRVRRAVPGTGCPGAQAPRRVRPRPAPRPQAGCCSLDPEVPPRSRRPLPGP